MSLIYTITLLQAHCTNAAQSNSKNNSLSLVIYPQLHYSLAHKTNSFETYGNIAAIVHGSFSRKNEIELLDVNGEFTIADAKSNEKVHTPGSLSMYLSSIEEQEAIYPITWHKKMAMLPHKNDKVEFFVNIEHGDRTIAMPEYIKKRMALYLLKDLSCENADCFHLCKNVALKRLYPDEVAPDIPLIQYMNFIKNENNLVPGDVVAFFVKGVPNEKLHSIYLKHYAIVLSKGIYLSKWGEGKPLSVSDLKSLMDFVVCDGYVKIDRDIGKREDFLKEPFRSIVYRPIIMEIYPQKNMITHYGYTTFLSGFHDCGKQFSLRRDINTFQTMKHFDDPERDIVRKQLSNNPTGAYVMFMHKKLKYLVGDELLDIVIRDQDDAKDGKSIYVPHHIKKKFLLYLRNNSCKKSKDCFDFCEKLCLNFYKDEDLFYPSASCGHLQQIVLERNLRSGDVVIFTDQDATYGKHYAIYLGDHLYLSKLGEGGSIIVSDKQFLHEEYGTSMMVRIPPHITRYASFWGNCLSSASDSWG